MKETTNVSVQCEGDFEYEVNDGKITITWYAGKRKDIKIPARIGNLPVTTIGSQAFAKKRLITDKNDAHLFVEITEENDITSVTIPDSVTTIRGRAFAGNQLTSVTIPNSVISIGDYAFAYNQLTSIIIPNSVTTIGCCAFTGNQLTSVTIPNSVTAIGLYAFSENKLTSITIPGSVTVIEDYAFAENQLTNIVIPANVEMQMSSFYCFLYTDYMAGNKKAAVYTFSRSRYGDFEIVVSNNVIEIVDYHGAGKTNIEIPKEINNLAVTAIGSSAFEENQLTSITIPGSVATIGSCAFAENQLTSVIIPDSVTSIVRDAFAYNQLTSIIIPNSVTIIEDYAFEGNQLTSVTIADSVTSTGRGAFMYNQLTSITIGADVVLGARAFYSDVGYPDFGKYYAKVRRQAGTYVFTPGCLGWNRIERENIAAKQT
jgi:hypothetical protein